MNLSVEKAGDGNSYPRRGRGPLLLKSGVSGFPGLVLGH